MAAAAAPAPAAAGRDAIGVSGERLTRDEAFDLLRRTVSSLVEGDASASASAVRQRAREVLGRDSESLSERNFTRILKDAHDNDVVDLRRRGDDFEVARSEAAPVSEQLKRAEPPPAPKAAEAPRLSIRGRGGRGGPRGRPSALPPELLSVGIVEMHSPVAPEGNGDEPAAAAAPAAKKRGGAKRAKAAAPEAAAKKPRRPRAKKAAKSEE